MSQTKLYVGNLSFETTEPELRTAFAAFGEVVSADIVMHRDTGRTRGFVEVKLPETQFNP